MSKVKNYIFITDSDYLSSLDIMKKISSHSHFEFIKHTDKCSTNKATDLFIGRINKGTIVFGGEYFYELFWNEFSEIRKNLINNFKDKEIIVIEYNDQIMIMGYIIIENGIIKRIVEIGEQTLDYGNLTDIELKIQFDLAIRNETTSQEIMLDEIVSHSLKELEKVYLGTSLDSIKCSELPVEHYKIK